MASWWGSELRGRLHGWDTSTKINFQSPNFQAMGFDFHRAAKPLQCGPSEVEAGVSQQNSRFFEVSFLDSPAGFQ